jgi:leucyl aminopeptidase
VPTLTVTTRPLADLAADCVVLGATNGEDGAVLAAEAALPTAARAHLEAALADADARGAIGEVHRVVAVPGVKATSVVVTGLGPDVTPDALRHGAANALRALSAKKHVVVGLPTPDRATLSAVADGAYAGCYGFTKISRQPAAGAGQGPKVTVHSQLGGGKVAKDAVARAEVLGRARDWARDLVNTPPNLLVPSMFEGNVKARIKASGAKVGISVLDEKALAKGGFGGIVGVGQGSANPPRIVTMSWKPAGAKASIALVGKGITFDSGGLCIKPAAGMATMKSDMAGAAAVAAAVLAAAELGLPVAVTGYLCLAENMPSGTAQRPSDVVTMRNGSTVEILDTDAEGRMVLADGIALAAEKKPDAIVDIATLTGAQMIALGDLIAGVMANDDSFRDRVVMAATGACEPAWPMPLPEELRKGLDSTVADIAHKADRWGGMLTAGIFLSTFVPEGTPWAHIDIAGPSFNEKGARGVDPKGGTGYGVGTLLTLVEQYS